MFDHERSLVNKYAGKPFALIGVNAGDELENVRTAVKEKDLNWRSFFDGDSNEITGLYAVQAFPTIYLIDHNGVIRYEIENPNELEKRIDELLAQVK